MTIGQVAAELGVSVHALRFYERQDLLLGGVARTAGGRRRYGTEDLDWLRTCMRLRQSGMPLAQLRAFAALVREGPGNEAQRLSILEDHEDAVRAQISELEECQEIIAAKVAFYRERVNEGTAADIWDPRATRRP